MPERIERCDCLCHDLDDEAGLRWLAIGWRCKRCGAEPERGDKAGIIRRHVAADGRVHFRTPSIAVPPSPPSPRVRAAWDRWPTAEWVLGDGRWAVAATCGEDLTVTLHPDVAHAEASRAAIDYTGCGGACVGPDGHYIADLEAPPTVREGSGSIDAAPDGSPRVSVDPRRGEAPIGDPSAPAPTGDPP